MDDTAPVTEVSLMEALSPVSGWPQACATISCDYCRAVLSFQVARREIRSKKELKEKGSVVEEEISMT